MKILVTASGNDLNAPLDSRFGRAANFIIYDLDTDAWSVIDNRQNVNAAQGAGIQSAETAVRSGARCLVTGHCGPKAFKVLSTAGVRVFYSKALTVSDALKEYRAGTLAEAASAET